MRLTKCRIKSEGCEGEYKKWSVTQKTCSNPACAIELMQRDKAKRARREHLAAKVKARSRRDWLKLAQVAFNAYIRKRDEALPCISCGRHHTGQYHAGHYLSTGARPELRFEEDNNHKQCSACNNHLSGNIALYRISLIKKIGLDRVEWLEGPHEPKKYTIEELITIRDHYRSKLKEVH
jgi:hypothetical protein